MIKVLLRFLPKSSHAWVRAKLVWINNSIAGGNKFDFAHRTNKVSFEGAMLMKCQIEIQGGENSVTVKKGTRLKQSSIFIKGTGNRLVIHDDCVITAKIELIGDNCVIEIGRGTSIRSAFVASFENGSRILIGKDCLFSHDIDIRTGDSHSIFDEQGARMNHAKHVTIGDHVWLGRNVTVLKGVHIGHGSIVGTCSVVSKNLGTNVLAVGVPAKVIREKVSWSSKLADRASDVPDTLIG